MSDKKVIIMTVLTIAGMALSHSALAQVKTRTSVTSTTETTRVAAPAVTSTTETTRVTRPLAVDGDTKEVKPAISRFIERVNMARLNLAQGESDKALFSLNEAEKHMRFIKKNSNYKEITKETVISSGQVVYDTEQTTYSSYYIPLEEGPVVLKDYVTTDNQGGKSSKKAIAVKSAKVVYLIVDLSSDTAEQAIAESRNSIKEGNLTAADETLAKMLESITVASNVESKPEIVARDNLQLALSFLQENNYVASRFALGQAIDALQKMKRDDSYSIDKVDSLTSRVTQIKDLVMQENEATAAKARTQIISAQGDLDSLS